MTLLLLVTNFHWDVPNDHDTIRLRNCLDTAGLKQHVSEPTHVSGHILDLVMTRKDINLVSSTMVGSFISDHGSVHCDLSCHKPKIPKTQITYRNFKGINSSDFSTDIQNSVLVMQPEESLKDLVDQYNSTLSDALDRHAPKKTKSIMLRPSVPWTNDDIFQAKRERRRVERRWRKTKLADDRDAFKAQRQNVNNMIAKAKTEYYHSMIEECRDDQKALFRLVDKLLHRRSKPRLPENENIQEVLHIFAEYFTSRS